MSKPTIERQGETLCPACQTIFEPRRSDQKFCTAGCRKNAHSRKERRKFPHNSQFSPTKWRENLELFDRNRRLVELYAKKPNHEARTKLVEEIIEVAESGHGQLRSLLINTKFLFPDKRQSLLFCPGYENFGTISQICNRYSWTTWGCSIVDALS